MTSWAELPLAGFDLETSGVDVFNDRLVTACVLRIDGGGVRASNLIANPGVPIPEAATAVHGITNEYAAEHGRPHADVVADVVAELYACWHEGRSVCVFNGAFDLSMIRTYAPDFEVRGLVVDASVLDKHYDQYRRGSRKLTDVAAHYGVRLDDAHNAEADALAAARLAWKLPRVYPHLAALTADELMVQQAAWYAEQAANFIQYLERQGKPTADVSTEWPIRTQGAQAA